MTTRTTGPDILAGLSMAGLLLPEAVAYSGLASLPPAAGVLAPGVVLGLAGPEVAAEDGADDCDAVVPPDDPHPVAVTVTAASPATARPRRALTERMIMPIPLVLAGTALRKPQALRPGTPTGAPTPPPS